jgi:hypothetical protein
MTEVSGILSTIEANVLPSLGRLLTRKSMASLPTGIEPGYSPYAR